MTRAGYFHGDLRRALLDAGLDVARERGPEGVSVRELARIVGVAPSAVYRHFAGHDELISALALRAQAMVADAMEREIEAVPARDPRAWADGAIAAVGIAYVQFAWAEPGLFRLAFRAHRDLDAAHHDGARGASGRTPYEQLERALDALVASGEITAEQRAGAEALAWSAVHGFATLTVEGPLRSLDAPVRDALSRRVVEMVRLGLSATAEGAR
ncbi:TetR/AcrR family transcriptional regulator [Agrococcus carbonis]|uniref:DNA-binding transcriptional regulator, AcrR family n=1 Tax=Agrococcus carbonis TaxID=684552 RepID=A0A1H1LLQ4_9MICO|nr:TetR/AcrR family transcriptional regulator [Agrococcus carbonis]SDR75448.1 DNA-binding transcriptional regulator, AcrR family [Agrococcus carbonis]